MTFYNFSGIEEVNENFIYQGLEEKLVFCVTLIAKSILPYSNMQIALINICYSEEFTFIKSICWD